MNAKERIKELAKKRNLTIAEVERNAGISNGTIGKWDKQNPSKKTASKAAKFFGVSTDYILCLTDIPNPSTEETTDDLDKMLDTAMSYDGKPLTEIDRAAIRAYIEGRFDQK